MRNPKKLPSLSKDAFSLPLAEGSYPFRLSEEESKLSPDDWAWLFLRLNPLYQHDYELWHGRHEAWTTPPDHLRPNGRPSRPLLPVQGSSPKAPREIAHPFHFQPISTATKSLDSRYFTINGEPLTGTVSALAYMKQTLCEYVEQHPTLDLELIRVREFDAPRDFGIGAWIDPQMLHLPTMPIPKELPNALLPGLGSWFYHVNEPIWQVNTLAFAHPKPSSISLSTLSDGQRIDFGSLQIAYPLEWTRYVSVDRSLSAEVIQNVQKGMPIPVDTPEGLKGTQFQFLVCLDGYVRPQLAMAFRIANAFRDLHKKHHPQSVQRGAPAIAVEIEVLPNAAGSGMGLYAQLNGPAVRIRKNWRVVTIDVAGALNGQQEYVDRKLIQQQKELGDQLTFPLRLRPRGEGDLIDNALKRALCILELHRHGADSQGKQRPLSHMRISHAIYCKDMSEYYEVRGIPIPPSVANARASTPSADFLDRAREGLELGKNLIQGWYEFVASRQFES